MSDDTVEGVAYKLLQAIAYAENKALTAQVHGEKPDRKWILETFAECRKVAGGTGFQKSGAVVDNSR